MPQKFHLSQSALVRSNIPNAAGCAPTRPCWPSVTSLTGRLRATRPARYQIRNTPHQRMAVHRVRRLSSDFICVEPLNQHLMESRGTVQSGGGAPPPSFSISLDNQLRHTLLSEPAERQWRPWAMPPPVYYLKISVKIPNKMTVCKPQRQKKGGQRVGGEISSLAFPPSFPARN